MATWLIAVIVWWFAGWRSAICALAVGFIAEGIHAVRLTRTARKIQEESRAS